MNAKPLTLLLGLLFAVLSGKSQNAFDTYSILGIGYIHIPKIMEEQSKAYEILVKKLTNGTWVDYEIGGDGIIIQQKGLNDLNRSGFASYARIIVETQRGRFEKLSTTITTTLNELNQISRQYKQDIAQGFIGTPLKYK